MGLGLGVDEGVVYSRDVRSARSGDVQRHDRGVEQRQDRRGILAQQ